MLSHGSTDKTPPEQFAAAGIFSVKLVDAFFHVGAIQLAFDGLVELSIELAQIGFEDFPGQIAYNDGEIGIVQMFAVSIEEDFGELYAPAEGANCIVN